jgi:hypothetical protein
LINQAKPGDVVVFHFSGHGSRVIDPDRDQPDGFNSTLPEFDVRKSARKQVGRELETFSQRNFILNN